MRIIGPNLLNLIYFLSDPLIQLIMEQRIEHLIEIHLRCSLNLLHVLVQCSEEVVEEVLIRLTKISTSGNNTRRRLRHHEHIIVADAVCGELLGIFL